MSLEMLRTVKRANEEARERDSKREAELAGLTANCPAHPFDAAISRPKDSTTGTRHL